jgi:hypothetical protein
MFASRVATADPKKHGVCQSRAAFFWKVASDFMATTWGPEVPLRPPFPPRQIGKFVENSSTVELS